MAESRTDESQDPRLAEGIYTTFEEWDEAQNPGGINTSADDVELDEIFSRSPEPEHPDYCLTCQRFIEPGNTLAVWVVDGPRYSPFCNIFCQEAYRPELALSIDEEMK